MPATTTHPGWTYREIFARDSYETFTGLLADGDLTSARAMVRYLYGERAEQDLQTGSAGAAGALLRAMQSMTSGLGMVPEQAWEDPAVAASAYGSDPATASIGFANGKPAGSASPLIWAQAQYLRLVTDLGSGSLGDQPGIVANRYVRPAPPAGLTVSAAAAAAGSQIVVTGTAPAGSTVVVSAGQPTASSDTSAVVSTVAGPDGHFRATVPLRPGTNVITATASGGSHATGWTQVTVKS